MVTTKQTPSPAKKIGVRFQNKDEILKVLKLKLTNIPLLYQLIASDGPVDGLTYQALIKLFRTGKYEKGEEVRAFEVRHGFWGTVSKESFEGFNGEDQLDPKTLGTFSVTRYDPNLFIDHEPKEEEMGQEVGEVEIIKGGRIFVWDNMLAYIQPGHKPFIDLFVW